MGYRYTPAYYSSIHDSITSLCKNILPFSFKKKRVPAIAAAEQRLAKQQSDNLKWQQDSFHQILKLMGLYQEGIVAETEVSAFRSHLLDTLIASPLDHEHSTILRDKLVFLQVSSFWDFFFLFDFTIFSEFYGFFFSCRSYCMRNVYRRMSIICQRGHFCRD